MGDGEDVLQRILDGKEGPTNLSLALLSNITDHFSKERKIGQGGFGAVYKGVLQNGIIVAVKRICVNIENIDDDDKQFGREFNSLWNTNHENLVRFLGFCSNTYKKPIQKAGSTILADVRERLFCFEYISNGSLDMHITDELRGFEWETRYKIIMGICKGLSHLHVEKNIIHMNLNPSNILLFHQDEKYMVPKIAGFGLSRPNEHSHSLGKCYGTCGYMAPEYRNGNRTLFQSDIYSLGAVIRELVTGCMDVPHKDNVLRRWRHRWNNPPTQLQYQQVTRCIDIAVRCREENPESRPSILEIISFLSESESTYGQIIPCLDEDDMLQVNPLQLRLPSERKNEISRSVELTNNTVNCIAFLIHAPSINYVIQPVKGIVQPNSMCYVKITVQPGHVLHDKFLVQSIKWSEGLRGLDIRKCMSDAKVGHVVDDVELIIVYEPTKPDETNMLAEEVPKFDQGESSRRTRTKNYLSAPSNKKRKNYLSAIEPMTMTFQELHDMTDGFSKKQLLGTGASGSVYKGVLNNGAVIAVKKLYNQPGLEDNQFENELLNLRRVQHQNIIRLVGYCSETRDRVVEYKGKYLVAGERERALCLEYMQGGTLEECISDELCGLDWEARYKLIKGICQGLKYLHTGSKDPIYHLDLKPANILLDEDLTPKIGDFGLSRLLCSTHTCVTKTVLGTSGYIPPEYIDRQEISPKFDVYSLGVIIIKIIAGRENYYKSAYMDSQKFIELVTGNWCKRVQTETMSTEALQELQKCIKIGLRCVEFNRENRPTITQIVDELNMSDLHPVPFCADAREETTPAALVNSPAKLVITDDVVDPVSIITGNQRRE